MIGMGGEVTDCMELTVENAGVVGVSPITIYRNQRNAAEKNSHLQDIGGIELNI